MMSNNENSTVTGEHNDYRQNREDTDGGKNAPTLSAEMHPDSIKNEHLTLVGGKESGNQQAHSPEVQQILVREGVADYALAPTIQQKPFVELQAISGYLSRQRNIRNRPRLFAWLASRDFGAQLLHGRRHSPRRETCVDVPRIAPPRSRQRSTSPSLGETSPISDTASGLPIAAEMLWRAVLTALQRDVAPAEFATWLEDTTLLDVDHTRQEIVVGTPNVFARDVVQERYITPLSTQLSAHLHQWYAIQVVVDGR